MNTIEKWGEEEIAKKANENETNSTHLILICYLVLLERLTIKFGSMKHERKNMYSLVKQ